MRRTVRKAIIPATKSQAKEMLQIVDKPMLQYRIEETIESGIEEHFDRSEELE